MNMFKLDEIVNIIKADVTINKLMIGGRMIWKNSNVLIEELDLSHIPSNIPTYDLVADFGGNGDGIFDNAFAFKAALNKSAVEGEIKVTIPEGIFKAQGPDSFNIEADSLVKGIHFVGAGREKTIVNYKHNRPAGSPNRHEGYFMRIFCEENNNVSVSMQGFTLDGILSPQEELFSLQYETGISILQIPLTRGIHIKNANKLIVKSVRITNIYGGYGLMAEGYDHIIYDDVDMPNVGGNDEQESFGMALYFGGQVGNSIISINNVHARGMQGDEAREIGWIGWVLENGTIQSNSPSVWMRDANTVISVTNSSFHNYQSTYHVESIAGNVYIYDDGTESSASTYAIVAGVYGEYRSIGVNLDFELLPFGRLWYIFSALFYSEPKTAPHFYSGMIRQEIHNSRLRYRDVPGQPHRDAFISHGNGVLGFLYNCQLDNVKNGLVTNGSAELYNCVINKAQGNTRTEAQMKSGSFSESNQYVIMENCKVNSYGAWTNVSYGAKPSAPKNNGYVAPFIDLPISAAI